MPFNLQIRYFLAQIVPGGATQLKFQGKGACFLFMKLCLVLRSSSDAHQGNYQFE